MPAMSSPVPAAAEATVRVINTPTSTPTASVVTGQQSLFRRKTNKNGKPTGKPVLSGFTIDFAVPLDAAAADNAANYQVDTVSTKKVKKNSNHFSSDHEIHRLVSRGQ